MTAPIRLSEADQLINSAMKLAQRRYDSTKASTIVFTSAQKIFARQALLRAAAGLSTGAESEALTALADFTDVQLAPCPSHDALHGYAEAFAERAETIAEEMRGIADDHYQGDAA